MNNHVYHFDCSGDASDRVYGLVVDRAQQFKFLELDYKLPWYKRRIIIVIYFSTRH